MINLIEYKGYYASVNISIEDKCLFGKIEFINDSIVFGADTYHELLVEFENAVDNYREFCTKVGREPNK